MSKQILKKIAALYIYFIIWLGNWQLVFMALQTKQTDVKLLMYALIGGLVTAYSSSFEFPPKFLTKKKPS